MWRAQLWITRQDKRIAAIINRYKRCHPRGGNPGRITALIPITNLNSRIHGNRRPSSSVGRVSTQPVYIRVLCGSHIIEYVLCGPFSGIQAVELRVPALRTASQGAVSDVDMLRKGMGCR